MILVKHATRPRCSPTARFSSEPGGPSGRFVKKKRTPTTSDCRYSLAPTTLGAAPAKMTRRANPEARAKSCWSVSAWLFEDSELNSLAAKRPVCHSSKRAKSSKPEAGLGDLEIMGHKHAKGESTLGGTRPHARNQKDGQRLL